LAFTDGKRGASQRNFTVKHLKNFGFGKRDLEGVIQREARSLVELLLASDGQQVEMNMHTFTVPVLNVLWEMVAGHAFKWTNERVKEVLALVNWAFSAPISVMVVQAPWIRFFFPALTGYNKRIRAVKGMQALVKEEVLEHMQDVDHNNPRDLIDAYLAEMATAADPEFHVEQLVMVCADLMGAGSDTTSTTLMWGVLYLALHPEVQARCHQEAVGALGEATATTADMDALQYCQATTAEIQRVGMVAVSTIQHRATRTVTIPTGHVIPADSIVVSNLGRFLSDPNLWDKPELFNPDRFLDASGKFFKPEHFVPLSHGKRFCLGEPLVKAELFIFMVTMMQRVRFEAIPGREPDPARFSFGLTRVPEPFTVRVHATSIAS